MTGLYTTGGFVGSTSGAVKNCVSTGTLLPGWSWNGGFAGYYDGSNIERILKILMAILQIV